MADLINFDNPPKNTDWKALASKINPDEDVHKWIKKQITRRNNKPFPTDQHYGYDTGHGKEHFIGTTTDSHEPGTCHFCMGKLDKDNSRKEMGEYEVHKKCPMTFKGFLKNKK